MAKTYKFFWGGIYSNFHPCSFTAGGATYSSSEQYFMVMKALYFMDFEIAKKMLTLTDPKAIKKLGREVKNFDAAEWDLKKEAYMYSGLSHKFNQNPELKKALLSEEANLFVEASPYDKIWGIGLSESAARMTPQHQWPGENLLGKLLTKLREELRDEVQ